MRLASGTRDALSCVEVAATVDAFGSQWGRASAVLKDARCSAPEVEAARRCEVVITMRGGNSWRGFGLVPPA